MPRASMHYTVRSHVVLLLSRIRFTDVLHDAHYLAVLLVDVNVICFDS